MRVSADILPRDQARLCMIVCACMYACMHVCIRVCACWYYVCVQKCMYVSVHVCMHMCECMRLYGARRTHFLCACISFQLAIYWC